MSRILIALLACSLLFTACTKKPQDADTKVVNLAIWGNYLTPEMQAKFEKDTGIKLNISNYSSSEELLAKVQAGSSGIDVAVPSDYMVDIMIKMNLLEELKADQIANRSLVSPTFLGLFFDPSNKYSLPYAWGTTGIAVNRALYKGPMKSWKDLLTNPELAGKFALLDDVREVLGAALIMNGKSVNSTDPEELKAAKAVILAAKKNVKMFTSDTVDILKNKEVVAAQTYSSDAQQAVAANKDLEYIIPAEGCTMGLDNLVILKGSKHAEAAHKLINFLLSPEVEQNKIQNIHAGPVLKVNQKLIPPDIKKFQSLHDLAEKNKLWEDIWTEIKTN